MKSESKNTVAASLEAEEKLLPYMPYLLQDLWGLGSSVEQIIQIFESLSFPSNKVNVLDLGCGKGAVSINIAYKFGYNVTGIDAMHEFLTDANNYAKEYNVAELCNFKDADIINFTKTSHEFDSVVLASLGGVFGDNKQTINTLRNQVKVWGYIIIDDGYLKNKTSISRKGYEHSKDYETTRSELISAGDKIISQVSTTEFNRSLNEEYLRQINNRFNELSEKYPKIKESLLRYINLQNEECEFLNSEFEGIIWVLQKCQTD